MRTLPEECCENTSVSEVAGLAVRACLRIVRSCRARRQGAMRRQGAWALDARRSGLTGLAAAVCLLAGGVAAQTELLPVENVRLPLETHANGNVKTQLTAKQATMPEDGPVQAKGVRLEQLDPDGKVEGHIEADECVYDKVKKTINSDGAVRMERPGIMISGKGFDWNSDAQTVRIRNNVLVELEQGLKLKDGFGAMLSGGRKGGGKDAN